MGQRTTIGNETLLLVRKPEPGHVADDLVEGRVDEPVELDLNQRECATDGHAHRGAGDAGLAQRGVDYPLGSVPLE